LEPPQYLKREVSVRYFARFGARSELRSTERLDRTIAAQEGVAIAEGHSIDDPEPNYGMAVTGLPVIDGVSDLAAEPRCRAGGSRRYAEYAEGFTRWSSEGRQGTASCSPTR
jgi:hypothetical protein